MTDKKIYTSEIVLEFNDFNINKDFDIFSVNFNPSLDEGIKKYVSEKMLDFTDIDYKALSVLYVYGTYMYCLYRKNVTSKEELKKRILERTGEEIEVREIDSRNTMQIKPSYLAQLLCNSLIVLGDDRKFHNLLGKLLYLSNKSFFGKQGINYIVAANITISAIEKHKPRYRLECKALSFYNQEILLKCADNKKEKEKILSSPKFVLDDEYNLRRMVDSIQKYTYKDIFVQRTLGSHNTISFADFSSPENFESSKVGIIHTFLKDVDEFLSNYITISLKTVNNVKTKKNDTDKLLFKDNQDCFDAINRIGLNINNKATDEICSFDLIGKLYEELRGIGITNISESNVSKEEIFNLILIHEPDYYKKNNLKDAYEHSFNAQHLIVEKCMNEKKALKDVKSVAKKCAYELMIKQDLKNQHITLYNDEFKSSIYYVAIENYLDNNQEKQKRFYSLQVNVGENIQFEVIDKKHNRTLYDIFMKYVDRFNEQYERPYELKYIIYDEKDTVLLMDNNVVTMPDLEEGYMRVMNYAKDMTITKEKLITYLSEFSDTKPDYSNQVLDIIHTIKDSSKKTYTYEEITNNQKSKKPNRVIPLISLSSSMAQEFVEFLQKEHGIILNMALKGKRSRSLINNQMTKINVFNNEYDNYDHTVYYYVGSKKSLKGYKFEKAIHIKGLIPLNDNNQLILKLINQLDVNFVRLGEYTVYPFPIKYLNEYKDMIKNV